MKAEKTPLNDCWLVEPEVYKDERGYFYESFNAEKFNKLTGLDFEVKQINQSLSSKGVLRGLHFQTKAQAKLVTCIEGEVLDVAVDLRKNSSAFGHYFSKKLSSANKKQLFIPKGMAHGFLVLSQQAKLMYLVDEFYSKAHDSGIIYNDSELNIQWNFPKEELILSEKDKNLPTLKKIGHTLG